MFLLQSVTQCTSAHHLFWNFWIQQQYWLNRSSPLKYIFMNAALLRHETVLPAQEKRLLPHYQVPPSCMSYNTDDTRCLLFSPMITLVNKSARYALSMVLPLTQTCGWYNKQIHSTFFKCRLWLRGVMVVNQPNIYDETDNIMNRWLTLLKCHHIKLCF